MRNGFRILTVCCAFIMAALFVVGAESHGVIRRMVEISPFWIAVAVGIRNSASTKWVILPWVFGLLRMTVLWSYLLSCARIVSGTFSPTEIAITMIVWLASMAEIVG